MSWKRTALVFLVLFMTGGPAFAAKPQNPPAPAVAAPEVYSVKIDYNNGLVIVEGADLDPVSATATLAGVNLTLDGASTDTTLLFPFSPAVSAVVDELGTYVMNITTAGGSFIVSAFIPFALVVAPPPPPPGPDCPCSTEWDIASTTPSPDGFAGLTPWCNEDYGDYLSVQFYDVPANNYWVLRADWDGSSSGTCELFLDGPLRPLTTQAEFDACADYINNIVTVWGSQGNLCLY